jgi:uncharacterized protein
MALVARGFKFPLQPSRQETPASSKPPDLLIESVKQILLTVKGERVMRPSLGSDLKRFLFENITTLGPDITKQRVQEEVRQAIQRWEPRVRVTGVVVQQEGDNTLTVDVGLEFLGYTVNTGPIQIN